MAIPLALGVVFSIISVANAMEAPRSSDHAFFALMSGFIGIPLLYASIVALTRRQQSDVQ